MNTDVMWDSWAEFEVVGNMQRVDTGLLLVDFFQTLIRATSILGKYPYLLYLSSPVDNYIIVNYSE